MQYTCPMHPAVKEDKPGMCPLCGMDLVEIKSGTQAAVPDSAHAHHANTIDEHAGHDVEAFARTFLVCLLLTIPVVLYSSLPADLLQWQAPIFPGSRWIPALLGTAVFFYGGWIFLRSARRELLARRPGMMTLIALAITAAYVYSLYQIARGSEETLFWELTTLVTIMLLGHYLEMKAVQGAQGALSELTKLLPDTAEVMQAGKAKQVPLSELVIGNVVMVRPGGRIPADGKVIEGESDVNESLATGETKPAKKKLGSFVVAGTTNGDGSLMVEVAQIGEKTFLAGVMRLVKEAQASKSNLQLLSDQAAYYLTLVALVAGVAAYAGWVLVGAQPGYALERLVAVLVVACPHALGLAIPLVASISTSKAARSGFLIRQRLALEKAREIDMVLFDKTGTLTEGRYGVEAVYPVAGVTAEEVLRLSASVDAKSEHPVSQAIIQAAQEKRLPLGQADQFKRLPGKGIEALVGGKLIRAGGRSLFDASELLLSSELEQVFMAAQTAGKTVSYVLCDGQLKGIIVLGDIIRAESKAAVERLRAMKVSVAMVTGDSDAVAAFVAGQLGIKTFFAQALPAEKTQRVKELQSLGKRVAFIGDGINDAPALNQADVGMAVGAGTNVAIESAGIILVKNDPRDIAGVIELSRAAYQKMVQNLFWATGYNVVAMPLAAGVLAGWGFVLSPALSALFMSLSTVIVAVNAVWLRRLKLGH
ncbi:MAG: heavy metal translocating P-type ATPase [Candidatus Andersenbacteria bacterium]|nr:heavy metal translocating P-type ATPase [Candidatus Andersenbacteria bacterium]